MHYMSNISSIMLWFFPLPLFSVEYYFISHELCYQFPLYLYMPTCVPPPIPFNCFFVVVQTCWPLVCRFDYCFVCCRSAKLGLRNVVWYLFRKKHCIVWKKKEDVLDYGLFTKGCHEKKKTKSEHVSDQLFLAWTRNYMMAAYSYTREQVLGWRS